MSRTISTSTTTVTTLGTTDNPTTILSTASINEVVGIVGTVWTVGNSGTVTASGTAQYGIELGQGGTVVNTTNGAITGVNDGVYIATPGYASSGTIVAGSVSNAGTISGATDGGGQFGIYFKTQGQVSNAATGMIGGASGIKIAGSNAVVTNLGSIVGQYGSGGGYGVYLTRSGTVTNGSPGDTTATIQGYYGLAVKSVGLSVPSTIFNYGTIVGTGTDTTGAGLSGGGLLINGGSGAAGALITGGRWGVFSNIAATIDNYGTIGATSTANLDETGVYSGSGGMVVRNTGTAAQIYGSIGVSIGYGTVINGGTIASSFGTTGTSVNFTAGTNRLIVDPGAVFTGTITGAGNGNSNTLELAGGGTGSIAGIGAQYTNFGTVVVDAGAYWTLGGNNSLFATASGTISVGTGGSLNIAGTLSGSDTIALNGGSLQLAGTVNAGDDFQFAGTNDLLQLNGATGTNFSNQISGFDSGDEIVLPGVSFQAGGTVTLAGGTLSAPLAAGGQFQFTNFTAAGTATPSFTLGANSLTEAPCFLPGTLILTDKGEVGVETLRIGDTIVTASGRLRPLCWIGHGKALATRGRRSAATPVIVRKGALGDNLPHRDLHITKGHALFLDNVLIPAEFLVNHRSILWDDRAQEVTVYHLELDAHDVLLANGVPAESYRDDGNRWLFQNANNGWDQPAKPPCAPVLTGGPVVDAVWKRVLARAGRDWSGPVTDDADLHLLVDGARVDPVRVSGDNYTFALRARPEAVRIVSRAGVPQELGLARDARCLGVALSGIAVLRGAGFAVAAAEELADGTGFHAFEPELGHVWTDGDAVLPAGLLAGPDGRMDIVMTVAGTTRYPDEGMVLRIA